MKKGNNGIERVVDNLGRVVIPMSFRKKLGIERNSRVVISLDDDTVSIKASGSVCSMCKMQIELNTDLGICKDCIERVKKYTV